MQRINKTVRVEKDTWNRFRTLAVSKGVYTGRMLELLINVYENKQEVE